MVVEVRARRAMIASTLRVSRVARAAAASIEMRAAAVTAERRLIATFRVRAQDAFNTVYF